MRYLGWMYQNLKLKKLKNRELLMFMKSLLARIAEWWREFVKNHIIDKDPYEGE